MPGLIVCNVSTQFDCLISVNGNGADENSFLIAEHEGRKVGIIKSSKDAPNIDERFFGAATARKGKKLHYITFLGLIGSDIFHEEKDLFEN